MNEEREDAHPLHVGAHADLKRVIGHIEAQTGLRTRWDGSLQVRDLVFRFSGQKHRSCGISIREDVLSVPAYRWSTMIHEGLHSVSGGFSGVGPPPDPWEEAIVEQSQRILRPAILIAIGIEIADDDLAARDEAHPYNPGIRRLEIVREVLRRDLRDFYLALLASSAYERTRIRIDAQRHLQSDGGVESWA
jgi:hypothetical protein